MDRVSGFLLVLTVVLLALNIKATFAVLHDVFPVPMQRHLQLTLVWLLPLMGALLVLAIHRKEEQPSRKYRDYPDLSDDFGRPGHSADILSAHVDGD